MDILAIRDKIRQDEKVKATLVNAKGEILGTLVIEDMNAQLAGFDVLDFYGEFHQHPDCPNGAECIGVSIDLGDGDIFAGGMMLIKELKGWKDVRKVYQAKGARRNGVFFHVEAIDIRDTKTDKLPEYHDPDEEVTLIGADGEVAGTLGDMTFETPEASGVSVEAAE